MDWDRATFRCRPRAICSRCHTPVTYLIGFGYTLWFHPAGGPVLQAGATGNRKRRLQFLLTMGFAQR